MKNNDVQLSQRPRRNRRTDALRRMVRETILAPDHLVLPLFVTEGRNKRTPIASMPGIFRLTIDQMLKEAREASNLGIPAVALFPHIDNKLKDKTASECKNPNGLLPRAIKALKDKLPGLLVITDVAMDPYSSDGHDGLVRGGKILNDPTLSILADMALVQAKAGADIVAPSDMMDGRVGHIRRALDSAGFEETGILSYAAKYCSALYGPFRDALDSAPKSGNKKTYQMDPANVLEAVREARIDVAEGADIVMVKPALHYLDVIRAVRQAVDVPVAGYHVSGEYAMVKAAAKAGWIREEAVIVETMTAIRRAGAGIVLTYFAKDLARSLQR